MENKQKAVWSVIVLRVLGYILMLFHPLEGFLLSLFLDAIDWHILKWGGFAQKFYHKIDKPLDYLFYIFFIPTISDSSAYPLYMAAMIYRALGYVAYYSTKNQKVFVLFADFPQVVAVLYLLERFFIPGLNILDSRFLLLGFSIKIFAELFHHVFPWGIIYRPFKKLWKMASTRSK